MSECHRNRQTEGGRTDAPLFRYAARFRREYIHIEQVLYYFRPRSLAPALYLSAAHTMCSLSLQETSTSSVGRSVGRSIGSHVAAFPSTYALAG